MGSISRRFIFSMILLRDKIFLGFVCRKHGDLTNHTFFETWTGCLNTAVQPAKNYSMFWWFVWWSTRFGIPRPRPSTWGLKNMWWSNRCTPVVHIQITCSIGYKYVYIYTYILYIDIIYRYYIYYIYIILYLRFTPYISYILNILLMDVHPQSGISIDP